MRNDFGKPPGFYPINETPIERWFTCQSPYHMPPTHMVIPYGMYYLHVCPECGQSARLFSPAVYMSSL